MMLYGSDLAYIHHVGFSNVADVGAPGLIAYLQRAAIRSGLVVDLGCGSGILAAHLLRAGYDVLGIDVSGAMVELARESAPQAEFIVGSLHVTELPHCVAVTAIGEGLSYLSDDPQEEDLEALVRRVYHALDSGGLFIFDVVERSPSKPMRYKASRSGPDWSVEVQVTEDPKQRVLTRHIVLTRVVAGSAHRSSETHRVRTFDRRDVEDMLAKAGFTVETTRSYGALDLPPRRIGFVAQKVRV